MFLRFTQRQVQIDRWRSRWRGEFEDVHLQHPEAQFVAVKKTVLGEGAERYAFQFYEVGTNGRTIVGKPLIAKESCYIRDHHEGELDCLRFVKKFCIAQQLTGRIAQEFNDKLDALWQVHKDTPRVSVLGCSIYHVADPNQDSISYLVEPRVDPTKWDKWNTNNGVSEFSASSGSLV